MQSLNVVPGIPRTSSVQSVCGYDEVVPYFEERNFTITGVTKDSTGVTLGACTVKLFNSTTDALMQITTSDASGNFSFAVDKTQTWYLVAYKPGGTPVAGTSINSLVGA